MNLQLYAHLVAILNGNLLTEQAGITIDDHVSRPCRITIESPVPESGPEVDARARIGERVQIDVHLMSQRALVAHVLRIEGPIVSASLRQPDASSGCAMQTFTVEQRAE